MQVGPCLSHAEVLITLTPYPSSWEGRQVGGQVWPQSQRHEAGRQGLAPRDGTCTGRPRVLGASMPPPPPGHQPQDRAATSSRFSRGAVSLLPAGAESPFCSHLPAQQLQAPSLSQCSRKPSLGDHCLPPGPSPHFPGSKRVEPGDMCSALGWALQWWASSCLLAIGMVCCTPAL